MRSRLTTGLLVLALAAFGAGGVYTASAHLGKGHGKSHHGKKHHRKHHKRHHNSQNQQGQNNQGSNGDNSAQNQYGTRPGKGCGDRNHVHTGPPGNPSNTQCPPQSHHSGTGTDSAKTKHHARHHGKKTRKHHKRRRHGHSS